MFDVKMRYTVGLSGTKYRMFYVLDKLQDGSHVLAVKATHRFFIKLLQVRVCYHNPNISTFDPDSNIRKYIDSVFNEMIGDEFECTNTVYFNISDKVTKDYDIMKQVDKVIYRLRTLILAKNEKDR